MIRLLLYSHDTSLEPLLTPALMQTCSIIRAPDQTTLRKRVSDSSADILLLDFDTNFASITEHLAFYSSIHNCMIPVVVMTDDMRRSTTIEILRSGAYDCVGKPPSLMELKVVVRRAFEHHCMTVELEQTRQIIRPSRVRPCRLLVGSSGPAQMVYDMIRRVANVNADVMITGESGTGKELVARAIHSLGNRALHPFVAVSCGAIPETLVEAELFGHETGAYTGSNSARAGYMERAGEGTLLLDDIGELSLKAQVKLLRVLQQREFTRLGNTSPIPLKARVLFATHRNLLEMVEAGTFRRDLYFRMSVVPIPVPPLRKRAEDIPALARQFLQQYSQEFEKDVRDIRPSAMDLLVQYDWPGNVRELEHTIQTAIILADGDSITAAHLPDHIRQVGQKGRGRIRLGIVRGSDCHRPTNDPVGPEDVASDGDEAPQSKRSFSEHDQRELPGNTRAPQRQRGGAAPQTAFSHRTGGSISAPFGPA